MTQRIGPKIQTPTTGAELAKADAVASPRAEDSSPGSTDRLEPPSSRPTSTSDPLRCFPARSEATYEKLGGRFVSEMAGVLSGPARDLLGVEVLSDGDEASLGRALGAAMADLTQALDRAGWKDDTKLSLLDELIGVALFARRAGRNELCGEVAEHVSAKELARMLDEVTARRPGDVLAVVVGAGAMGIGMSQLIGHGIRPGGHSWRDRVIVATPFAHEYEPINRDGRFTPGTAEFKHVPVPFNFAEGPRIEAVPLDDVGDHVAAARAVLLMVPSRALC